MSETQSVYLHNLNKMRDSINSIALDSAIFGKIDDMTKNVSEAQLLVPVVGAFSAGKSSLINFFLGADNLSVDITPETSLATELHYATQEMVKAIRTDDVVEEYELDEFDVKKLQVHNYLFLRFFIDNNRLQEISPLTLVDMPGFDSPLDAHNKSIMNYISKSSHFLVVVSVEDGTIPRSVLRQLIDLKTLGHSFNFFLSKTNLRNQSDVDNVAQEIIRQISDHLGEGEELIRVDNHGGEQLSDVIQRIDPELLFKRRFRNQVLEVANDVLAAINTRIAALGNKEAENRMIIKDLSAKINAMQLKAEEMKNDIQDRASEFNNNVVLNSLNRELSAIAEELVTLIVNDNQEGAERMINDTVRSCLLHHVQNFSKETSEQAAESFIIELGEMKQDLENSGISDELVGKLNGYLTDNIQGFLSTSLFDNKTVSTDSQETSDRTNDGILAATASIVKPIIGLIVIVIPYILQALFKEKTKDRQREIVRQKLLNEVFPSIKAKLRQELPQIINDQSVKQINAIGQKIEEKLSAMRSEFTEVEQERQNNIATLEQEKEQYDYARKSVASQAQAIAAL